MADLERGELLCIPKRRRLVHDKRTSPEGQIILHVFYGEKEIIFDEPDLLPFGDKLVETERFRAEEAMAWSIGAPHDWEKVRELLEALLDQEILKRVTEVAASPGVRTFPPTLGRVAPGSRHEPQAFSAHHDKCPMITEEAFGRAIDLSNLEAVVPVYRVAHPTLDRDGRQVGENNVVPRHLFLDLPTERRVCNYPGDRYQADEPMNVTALRHMTRRWPELLSLTEQFRRAFFARLPPRDAALRAGEAQLLTVCCLASVGYVMVRGVDPVANGELDAGLAAVFRLIDGVRLVTTEMLRDTAGKHGCDRPVNAQIIADYAERNGVYHGTSGVCAGPQALIDEYLRVLLDGASAPIEAEPDFASRVGELDAAIDYGLHGQRIEAMIRAFGASQGLLNERLRGAFRDQAPRAKLQELLELPIDAKHYPLLRAGQSPAETFALEIEVNRWIFEQAGAGLPREARGDLSTIDDLLRLDPSSQACHQARLGKLFAQAFPDQLSRPDLCNALAGVAGDVFALERRCLRAVGREQQRLNDRLRRRPAPPLSGRDLAIYNRPRTGPPLELTLADGLGLSITNDASSTLLSYGDHSLSLTD
jgi:hypothetical protein